MYICLYLHYKYQRKKFTKKINQFKIDETNYMDQINFETCISHNTFLKNYTSAQFMSNMYITCSRNNQHNAQICTTVLFYMLAPTCFGGSLPSSGSFWIRLSYAKIHIDTVVYHIMLVKWPVCQSVVVQSVV
jgi:hypothetical protein